MTQETRDMLAERGREKADAAHDRFRTRSATWIAQTTHARRVALNKLVRDFRADHDTPITLRLG